MYHDSLKDKEVASLDFGFTLREQNYRENLKSAQRTRGLRSQVKLNRAILFFVDEIHMTVGAGSNRRPDGRVAKEVRSVEAEMDGRGK